MLGHFRRLALCVLLALVVAVPSGAARAAGGPQINQYLAVRAAAILTNSYVGTTALDMAYSNQLVCLVSFTLGSLTTLSVKAQFSQDNSTWFDESILNTAGGSTSSDEFISPLRTNVYSFDATSTKIIAVPLLARYARLALKGVGTVTSSSATVACFGGAI